MLGSCVAPDPIQPMPPVIMDLVIGFFARNGNGGEGDDLLPILKFGAGVPRKQDTRWIGARR
jgi:hypothetical protein